MKTRTQKWKRYREKITGVKAQKPLLAGSAVSVGRQGVGGGLYAKYINRKHLQLVIKIIILALAIVAFILLWAFWVSKGV